MYTDKGQFGRNRMTKEKMLEIIQKLLETDIDLDFLLRLNDEDLRTLVACIRERVDQAGNEHLQ